ncbi:PPIase cyclophilin-type domain-containing protein [Heracleum sosnowskyi]|uniref:PPIase cyclophilin-type domain-containing protein n=1 Tax=Heracleum sosnowskyi TaxID=360622 RepID=A0AAD8IN38_9APIA|nr:PPIase cyclophilin-type domain-containing protein [Heracleum sosnowskyi]
MHSTAKCLLNTPATPPNQQIQALPTTSPPCILKNSPKFSRRELAICTKSSLLLVLGSQAQQQFQLPKARAEEENADALLEPDSTNNLTNVEESDNSDIPTTVEENQEISTTTESNASDSTTSVEENPPSSEANATAQEADSPNGTVANDGCTDRRIKKRAFFDVSVNGEPIGRIVIGLYDNNAPITTGRFSNIISGAAGISYRRKEFVKILPNYVQHGGIRSYGVDAELAQKTGSSLSNDRLIAELEKANESCPGTKNVAKSVSIIVRDPLKPPPKTKLVARNGKLVIDEEEIGRDPNGTEFVISTKDSPELDASALVVGRVLEGMEVVEKIGQVKTVQENTSSPYFRTAKLIGDKRAVVAERGFNRPYSKVIVNNCGLME